MNTKMQNKKNQMQPNLSFCKLYCISDLILFM